MIRVEPITGAAIAPHLHALASLRIAVFHEYPYLYAGSLEYEQRYLASYAATEDGIVVLALDDDDRVVGAATAMPLVQHSDDVVPPLVRAGYAPDDVYYFGESVLQPVHRGIGIGVQFFDHREARARALGYRIAAFCAVDRSASHPRRPANYRPLDPFWQKRGFVRHPDITATFSWRDVGDAEETPHAMTFWLKELA